MGGTLAEPKKSLKLQVLCKDIVVLRGGMGLVGLAQPGEARQGQGKPGGAREGQGKPGKARRSQERAVARLLWQGCCGRAAVAKLLWQSCREA